MPGQFGNLLRVLVPDATVIPIEFHDIILEDLGGTPDSRSKLIVPCQFTSLRRRWHPAVFAHMHQWQADMEYLHRACRQQYVSEFGDGKGGTCPPLWSICNW